MQGEGRDWNVVSDGGDCGYWFKNGIRVHRKGQIVDKGPMGTIGLGVGFALGAWAANRKPVLYFVGDGSIGFNGMGFDTYSRFQVLVVCVVVVNDAEGGMIKMAETWRHPGVEPMCLDLAHMRKYELFPAMWGGKGFAVTRPEDNIPAIMEIHTICRA